MQRRNKLYLISRIRSLEPINIAELVLMQTPVLVLVMTYQLKNVNYARLRIMCIQNVTEYEYHKERARTEESIQDLDVLEDTLESRNTSELDSERKERKEVITKTVEKFEVPRKRIRELYKECKK